jgi:3-hydroxyisobutyrate dehydrogenase-like beta-hydroxyacid dehydrogenase
VDRQKMMTLLNTTIFDCLIYKGYGQRVADRDHFPYPDAHFGLELGLKDVSLVADTAARSAVPMPVCSVLKDRYLSAKARGWADLDWSAIGMAVSADAGAPVGPDVEKLLEAIKT